MAASDCSDNKILLFNNNGFPEWIQSDAFLKKIHSQKNIFYKEKDQINTMFDRKRYRKVWSEENFIRICHGSTLVGNQMINEVFVVRISLHKMWIWSTNLQIQCAWKSLLWNLRNFQATDTFYACFHRSTAFTFAPGVVGCSTTHIICSCIISAGQITHRIPAIRKWNLWFFRFIRVWLEAKFFDVSHSFDLWISARQKQRFTEGHFPK